MGHQTKPSWAKNDGLLYIESFIKIYIYFQFSTCCNLPRNWVPVYPHLWPLWRKWSYFPRGLFRIKNHWNPSSTDFQLKIWSIKSLFDSLFISRISNLRGSDMTVGPLSPTRQDPAKAHAWSRHCHSHRVGRSSVRRRGGPRRAAPPFLHGSKHGFRFHDPIKTCWFHAGKWWS